MQVKRLTVGQAMAAFLKNQYVERDGVEYRFFAGVLGIFGHGIIGGFGQALQQSQEPRYYQTRNEQASVHIATAFAKVKNRMQTMICISSIGPGATNMVTGAATATVNRLPVLLIPGDIFARRNVAPVLQQLESPQTQDISVNDCFKPVTKYWDRINRPDQIITALPEVMRVLTSPADTGAAALCMPQDVQAEAWDYPAAMFEKRVWRIPRNRADSAAIARAAALIRASKRPMVVAGGGVLYSSAEETLRRLVAATGIPVGETMAGKNSLRYDDPLNMGAIGVTGTRAANIIARDADLVIGIGTRYTDFTTCSKTAFREPDVRFVNINVAEFDAFKHHAVPVTGDAKVTLEELSRALEGWRVDSGYEQQARTLHDEWETEVSRIYEIRNEPLPSQGEIVGAVNELSKPESIMVCAAGSLPGDLHKLWRSRHSRNFHMEYGYSCMGYEIAGGLGAKMAEPARDVYVLVGDGSYLMLANEIVTSVQEGYKLIIVLFDSEGYNSIGGLSRSLGQKGFGTRYAFPEKGALPDDESPRVRPLPIDLAENARSLGAAVIKCANYGEFTAAMQEARKTDRTTVLYVHVDRYVQVPGYESWWDVPPAEVSEMESVRDARRKWEPMRAKERYYHEGQA
jgi:3D-(3,5/4)-trihydroxycyclohexane-1,2-dione acylhydrolase (decyclizing)